MGDSIALRILEIEPGQFVVQFEGGLDGWTTFSDTFATRKEAEDFLTDQRNSADFDAE